MAAWVCVLESPGRYQCTVAVNDKFCFAPVPFPDPLSNTHTHAAMSLLRGYADDMILQDWLTQKMWPLEAHLTGEDVYWGTRLACLEMIRTGTSNDMYFFMEDAARAVDEAGIRALLCYGFIDLGNPEKREHECKATEALARHIRKMNNPRFMPLPGRMLLIPSLPKD